MNIAKISLQEYADCTLPERFRQRLKTLEEACADIGWGFQDFPECCNAPVEIHSFIGSGYAGVCKSCGKFILDVTGPQFGNSWVNVVDSDKVDLEKNFDRRWISGIRELQGHEDNTGGGSHA